MGGRVRTLAFAVLLAAMAGGPGADRAPAQEIPEPTPGVSAPAKEEAPAPAAKPDEDSDKNSPKAKEAAANKGKTAADAKAKQAAAKRAFEAGAKAFEAGKNEQAVQSLTTALRGGGLPSQEMAKALYYRGLAYRKQRKPGLAISDLTSAVWLKGGLTDSERADAIAKRSEAYREAGRDEQATSSEKVVTETPGDELPWRQAASEAVPAPPPSASAPSSKVSSTWETATAASTDEPAQPAANLSPAPGRTRAPEPQPGTQVTAALSAAPVETAAVPAAAPLAPAPSAPQSSSSGGFFSNLGNLFSGSSATANSSQPGNQTTADVPEPTASADPVAATSSWINTTHVAPAGGDKADTPKVTQTAAIAPPVQVPPPEQTGGKFKLQVAAVRSREEADALAAKLIQQHGAEFGARQPLVDEAVLGNMGTFYRVRLGSYRTADEPRRLCTSLKATGYDCLIVTQ